ncbi:MAG: chemotaxis protein CheC [Bacillota bacterium]
MEDEVLNLSEIQKDALKEIGNIGAGNAATAFAEFLNKKIDMTVPSIDIVPLTEVPEITGSIEEKIFGILLTVNGEAPGEILFILSEDSIKHLLKLVMEKEINPQNVGEIEVSALKEIGNILSGSYLSSINQMTGFGLTQSIPGFAHDMAGAILSSAMINLGDTSDFVLLIKTKFISEGNEIKGFFFFIPKLGSLHTILKALGIDTE